MSDSILFEVDGGVAHVTLNRPTRLNAINDEAAYRWRDVAAEIAERADVSAVLLDAAGPAFCAGGDVAAMAGFGEGGSMIETLAHVIHEGHHTFATMPKPIVAAVQGAVAGGGLGFMLTADYVVAGEAASFASKYADIGLTPDCGVSTLLPEAIGTRRALELTLTSRRLDAREALDWGLVNEVTTDAALTARARQVAAAWVDGAAAAFGQAKRLVRAQTVEPRSYREALSDEAATIGAAFETPQATERIAAFAARSSRRQTASAPSESAIAQAEETR
ncbi:enoyl-CoA hydratase/isomerase family protein [Paramicrobacterium agarici]|uniref:enoyl-CoA hydratase/isomerase family protein n=1 Tax=Paramicrobacterium agarici TaxID=630514 RepID=UPI001153A74B|nr:enoyl-CoA hydratase/isomerase family protein [Microbacterium agarici]TQO22474.1 enoyl-CoA hydratase [Microbacterium agarici]